MIPLIVLLFSLFGSTFVVGEVSVTAAAPFFFIGMRMLIAGLLLLAYLALHDTSSLRVAKRDWPLFAALTLMLIFIPYVTEFWALQYISGAKSALLWNLTPFITAVFAYFMFGERMTAKKLFGLLLGFVGFVPILVSQQSGEEALRSFTVISTAEFWLIVGVIAGSYGWILVKSALKRSYSVMTANAYAMLFSGVLSLFCSRLIEQPWSPVPVSTMNVFVWCLIYLVLVGNVICYNLYGHLLKKYTATFISFAGFSTPLFAAVIQYLFLGQPVSIYFYLTAVLVGVGLYIFYQEELRQGYFNHK